MANPNIPQGGLNRLIASVSWPSLPILNVTPPYLGKEAIRLALDGDSTLYVPTLTGAVTSPEPYLMITLTIHLLKTQPLANFYKIQMETLATIGNGVVRPDVTSPGIGPYPLTNCAISGVRELNFSGEDAGYAVVVRGYYTINNSLWG